MFEQMVLILVRLQLEYVSMSQQFCQARDLSVQPTDDARSLRLAHGSAANAPRGPTDSSPLDGTLGDSARSVRESLFPLAAAAKRLLKLPTYLVGNLYQQRLCSYILFLVQSCWSKSKSSSLTIEAELDGHIDLT